MPSLAIVYYLFQEDKETSGPFIVVYDKHEMYMLKPVLNRRDYYFDHDVGDKSASRV